MGYWYRIFNSIDDLDFAAWERLRSEAKASVFTDPRFVGAVQAGMNHNCSFLYVVIHDSSDSLVAFACLTIMTIDVADFAGDGLLKRIISEYRQAFATSLFEDDRVRTTHLDWPQPVGTRTAMRRPAGPRRSRRDYPQIGRQDQGERNCLQGIRKKRSSLDRSFARFRLSTLHHAAGLFSRSQVQQPRRILQGFAVALPQADKALASQACALAGVEIEVLTDAAEIVKVYTEEVHALYHQMREKAQIKYEFPVC